MTRGELAYYRCWSPAGVTFADLVRVAGARWAVEESFQAAKNETALDPIGDFVAACAAEDAGSQPAACGQLSGPAASNRNPPVAGSDGQPMICLTMNEIRRLHAIFSRPVYPVSHRLRWSLWRRRHRARARPCHYQRRRQRDR